MVKKLIFALLIAFPFSVFAQKFGIVDAESVVKTMPEYAAVTQQVGEISKKYEDEFAKLAEELNKKYAEFQTLSQDASTPESIKERRIQEIQELDQKMQQFRNSAEQDIARQQQQLMAPVEQKFMDAVKAVGQEGGYVFIFPRGISLYDGTSVIDVTDAIKAKLGIK